MPDKSPAPAAGTKADIEAAARLAARAAARKKDDGQVDIGKQKGIYDTADIRSSIHKWQALGEEALPPSEAGAISDTEDGDEVPARPLHSSARQPLPLPGFDAKHVSPPTSYGIVPVSPERQSRRHVSMAVDRDVRAASAPKKRVVSDQHWMKDKGQSPPKKDVKPVLVAEGVSRRPDAWVRAKPPPKPPKEEKSPREPPPPLEKGDIIKYLAGAAPAYKPQHPPHTPGKALIRERPSPEKLEAERARAQKEEESKEPEPPRDPAAMLAWFAGASKPKNAAADKGRTKSQEPSKQTPLLDEKEIPGSNRISSWLGDMPDPFTEDPKRLARETRKPADRRSSFDEDDDNLNRHNRGRRDRGHRSRSGMEDYDGSSALDDGRSSPASAGTLKRRHARRSKSRPRMDRARSPGAGYNDTEISYTSEELSLADDARRRRRPSRPGTGSSDKENNLSHDAVATLNKTGLKRRLTTHEDLMTVLSAPRGRGKSTRSVRMNKVEHASFEEIINELKADESKYLRELRTLVDGVIPVLLKSVLSTTSAAAARNLFGPGTNSANATTPIVNMGIALERLKSAHKRIPFATEGSLLAWAQSTHQIYEDYLKAWRMGFQDVMVNLAPSENALATTTPGGWDKSLQANPCEDSVADSEKADVAFLLKRPLVRIKHLSKTMKAIHSFSGSDLASTLSSRYQSLVAEARRRQAEELARLEDEAASNTDATKARDVNTLAPLAGVQIDPTRCVKARDLFDLKLQHSSGQRVDCRVEIILRYSRSNLDNSNGDLLVCEVDSSARWLLFPPITVGRLSARHAPNGDLIVMIRGMDVSGNDWYELLSLRSVDSQAIQDWTQMLGTSPVPPEIKKPSAFVQAVKEPSVLMLTDAAVQAVPSEEVQVPIGEQASVISSNWKARPASSFFSKAPASTMKEKFRSTSRKVDDLRSFTLTAEDIASERTGSSRQSSPDRERRTLRPNRHSQPPPIASARSLNEAMLRAGTSRPSITRDTFEPPPEIAGSTLSTSSTPHDYNMVRRRIQGHSRYTEQRPTSRSSSNFEVWMPPHDEAEEDDAFSPPTPPFQAEKPTRPTLHHRTSSVPTDQMPQISRSRQSSPIRQHHRSNSEVAAQPGYFPSVMPPPASAPASPEHDFQHLAIADSTPPPQDLVLRDNSAPYFSPSLSKTQQRRSSSPLKQQYLPSDGEDDDSSVDGHLLSDDDDASSITSNSSADDLVPSLLPNFAYNKSSPRATAPNSIYSPNIPGTVAPSQSASQVPSPQPHRRSTSVAVTSHGKTVGSIFCWSDKGSWESIHSQECSITVSPGLIEAFKLTAAHYEPSQPIQDGGPLPPRDPNAPRPLLALELTPLVPLRRGTALDISIRSPPTSESLLKPPSTNIMFRSRTAQECELLYAMLNQARINNAHYIALQNARPGAGFAGDGWAERMARQNAAPSSWFKLGRKGSSYRAGTNTRRTVSFGGASIAPSESSAATIPSAILALKRFSAGSKMFNVAKSTVTSRVGARSSSAAQSSSSGGLDSGSSTPLPSALRGAGDAPLGLANVKMRLYYRESASKWRDMGGARLTILQPPAPPGQTGPILNRDGSVRQEKRVLVLGKHRGEVLLDVTLGESAFERVARTGIAINMVEQHLGENGEVGVVKKTGGVGVNRQRVYMLQMRSEADAAYTFSLVSRLRY